VVPVAVTQPYLRTISGGVAVTLPSEPGYVQWSPDARHILFSSAASVELFDDAGTVMTRVDGAVSAAWIDSNAFATATDCSDSASIGQVSIHRLGGGEAVLDGQFDTTSLVGNGHGAVALSKRSLESPQSKPSFVVWAGGRTSRAIAGEPVAWSTDGSKLLVRASTAWGTPALPEIIPYPSLAIDTSFVGGMIGPIGSTPVFSPDGRLIGLPCGIPSDVYYCTSMVLEAAHGTWRAVTPAQADGLPMSWLSNGHLLLQPNNQPAAGSFREWDGARVVPSKLPAGAWAVASPDGRLVAIGTSPDPASGSTLVVTATGASVTRLPSTGGPYQWVTWSPDSTHLAVWDDPEQELDLVRVGPPA
jgi:hypothetical protein